MRLLQKALTFDDVLLVPAYSEVLPRDVQLRTRLTREITLNLPMVSAAMDTVSEANLAIAMAQEGGIGIIHKNLTAQQQAAEVAKVKRHESGVVSDPITVGPDMLVGDVIRMCQEHRISGVPVNIWLNKYAGPAGGQKGLRLCLRDGRIISHDRRGAEDVLELSEGKDIQRWHIPGTLYEHCLAGHILGTNSLFERDPHEVSRTTRRRIEEVELLLTLQPDLMQSS